MKYGVSFYVKGNCDNVVVVNQELRSNSCEMMPLGIIFFKVRLAAHVSNG